MTEAALDRSAVARGDAWRAIVAFCAVTLALTTLYVASVVAFAELGALADPNGRFGLARIVRFNAALGLVFAYLCASLWLGQRWIHRDFDDLRPAVDASDAEWEVWRRRALSPSRRTLVSAASLGFLAGIGVDLIGARAADAQAFWIGHRVWVHLLNPMVFSVIGLLVAMSAERAAVYQEIGRRARVSLGDIAPLAPFARVGLRTALLWFLGTSLASLLMVDTDSPMLVLSILVGTTIFAGASLIAPSRGVHERMRELKRSELAALRGEIDRASAALRRSDAAGASLLPALLAWEGRVRDAPEWPFDTSTWLRFALLLLVPLGSWLGGALAEHLVERWLSA
jgi:hypothetical protein